MAGHAAPPNSSRVRRRLSWVTLDPRLRVLVVMMPP